MTTLNADASGRRWRRESAARRMSRVSGCSAISTSWREPVGVTAVVDSAAVPYLEARARRCGGLRQRRHAPQPGLGGAVHRPPGVRRGEALLLADAQTSGGLLIAGEMPGAPVIGELVPRGEHIVVVR